MDAIIFLLCLCICVNVSTVVYITTKGIMKQIPIPLVVKYTPMNTFSVIYTYTYT